MRAADESRLTADQDPEENQPHVPHGPGRYRTGSQDSSEQASKSTGSTGGKPWTATLMDLGHCHLLSGATARTQTAAWPARALLEAAACRSFAYRGSRSSS